VLGLARLFEPVGFKLRERVRKIDGVHRRKPPVALDQNVDIRADGVADRAGDLDGAPDVILRDIGSPRARKRIEFQRREAALQDGFRAARLVLGRLHLVAPAVRVDANAHTAGPPEQIIDRLPGHLADDIPQRLLDARGGAIELQRPAALRVVVERDLQDMTDVERIAAYEIAAEFLDLRGDGAVAVVLAIGFAPTDDTGVGLDAHKDEILAPARMDRKTFHAGDFHGARLRRRGEESPTGSKRPVALDRHATARARLRVVVPQRLMLDAAVVPEGHRMRLPAEPALEFLARRELAQ